MQVSNELLAKNFVCGATDGMGSNMFIRGDTIYSFGEHFKIAIRLAPMVKFSTNVEYVFNSNGYSNCTAKHKNHVRRKWYRASRL